MTDWIPIENNNTPYVPVLTDKSDKNTWQSVEETNWIPIDTPPNPVKETNKFIDFSTAKRVAWTIFTAPFRIGLGIGKAALQTIAFPFTAIEKTIASPLTPIGKNIASILRHKAQGIDIDHEMLNHLPAEMLAGLKAGLKAWIPGSKDEKETADFMKFWRVYADTAWGDAISPGAITKGEYGPYEKAILTSSADVMGFASSFIVTPAILGKVYKSIRTGLQKTKPLLGITKKLPELEMAKIELAAEKATRTEKVAEFAKKTYMDDMQKLADEVSKETGLKVGPKAVSYRLHQLSGGMGQQGITNIRALKSAQNDIIKEFEATTKEYKALGLLSDIAYNQKLTKSQWTANLISKAQSLGIKLKPDEAADFEKFGNRLLQRIDKLKASKAFKGKSEQINKVQDVLDELGLQRWTEELYGGAPYLPREYAPKVEKPLRRFISFFRPTKIIPIKRRELYLQVHPEARKIAGEITDVQYPVLKNLLESSNNIANAKFFEGLSKNEGLATRLAGKFIKGDYRVALQGWKQIPDEAAYGKLRGMFTHPQVYDYVMDLKAVPSDAGKFVDKWLSYYKISKVALSPTVQSHNLGGDFLLRVASGVKESDMPRLTWRIYKEKMANTPEWQKFFTWMKGQSYFENEIFTDILSTYKPAKTGIGSYLQNVSEKTNKVWKLVTKYPERFYRNHELNNKAMIYYDRLNKGDSAEKAFQYALKWGINYGDLTQFEKTYVRRVMPFYSFPRHAVPLMLEAFAERPYVMAKYAMFPKLATQFSLHRLKIDDKDWQSIKKDLPDYIDSDSYILMPYRDKNGDLRLWDWTQFLPWNNIADAQERGVLKTVFNNPIYQIVSDITHNKSSWTDQPIWKDTDTKEEKFFAKMSYVWNTLAPTLATKKFFWDKVYNAVTGKTVKGKRVLPTETMMQTLLGVRTVAVDVALNKRMSAARKSEAYQELVKKLSTITMAYNRNEIGKSEYEYKKQQYIQQIKDLYD